MMPTVLRKLKPTNSAATKIMLCEAQGPYGIVWGHGFSWGSRTGPVYRLQPRHRRQLVPLFWLSTRCGLLCLEATDSVAAAVADCVAWLSFAEVSISQLGAWPLYQDCQASPKTRANTALCLSFHLTKTSLQHQQPAGICWLLTQQSHFGTRFMKHKCYLLQCCLLLPFLEKHWMSLQHFQFLPPDFALSFDVSLRIQMLLSV